MSLIPAEMAGMGDSRCKSQTVYEAMIFLLYKLAMSLSEAEMTVI